MNRGKLFLAVAVTIVTAAALGSSCAAATLVWSEGWNPAYPASNTVDGLYGPSYAGNMGWANPGAYAIYDLGTPMNVRKMRIAPPYYGGSTPQTFNPRLGEVRFSNDMLNWYPADMDPGIAWSAPALNSVAREDCSECSLARPDSNTYQYLKWTITDGGRVGEVWFLGDPQIACWEMNQEATYSGLCPAWQTVDGYADTHGVISGDPGGYGEPYITYDIGSSQAIYGFTMQSRAAWAATLTPTGGELWVSGNPTSGYSKVGNWSAPSWADGETKTFNLGNAQLGRYVQLRNMTGGYQWAEFQVLSLPGETPVDSWWGFDNATNPVFNTMDGKYGPSYRTNCGRVSQNNAWVIYDLSKVPGYPTPIRVSKMRLHVPTYGGSGNTTYNPTAGTLEFSNDKVTWTPAVSWTMPPLASTGRGDDWAEVALPEQVACRYARVTFTSEVTPFPDTRVAEVIFVPSPTLAVWENNQSWDYVVMPYSAWQTADGEGVWNANSFGAVWGDTGGLGSGHLTYDLGSTQKVYGFAFGARRWDNLNPTSGSLWVSDDPVDNYKMIAEWTMAALPAYTTGALNFGEAKAKTGRFVQLRGVIGSWAETTILTPAFRPASIPYSDSITIDGNLNDWADATWAPLDKTYSGAPADTPEAYYSAKWGDSGNKLYVAAKVRDTAHFFTNSYPTWNGRDAIEIYVHTTGAGPKDYSATQADAQHYAIGIKNSDNNSVWAVVGDNNTIPVNAGFSADGSVSGDWLYYEAALTPFQTFSLSGSGLVVSTLSAGQVIGLDVVAVGHNGTSYTGMLSENLMTQKYANYDAFGLHMLTAASVTDVVSAKTAVDGSAASFAATVTRAFGDYFYVEASDRSSGIRIEKVGAAVSAGQTVNIVGVVATLASGERKINASSVSDPIGYETIRPLAMNNKTMGGGNFGTLPQGQPGVPDGTGLNNIGLFVKAWGRCTSLGGNLYSLNDGSGVSVTMQVLSGSVAGSPFVSAQGIMSCVLDGSTVKRLLIVKDASADIQVSP